jgi:hypothetical protein
MLLLKRSKTRLGNNGILITRLRRIIQRSSRVDSQLDRVVDIRDRGAVVTKRKLLLMDVVGKSSSRMDMKTRKTAISTIDIDIAIAIAIAVGIELILIES